MAKNICPHCNTAYNVTIDEYEFYPDNAETGDKAVRVICTFCPNCGEAILSMNQGVCNGYYTENGPNITYYYDSTQIYPNNTTVKKLDDAVPEEYAKIYNEAVQVLRISPRASATLSRYLLQLVLHKELKIVKRTLEEEINELINRTDIPSTFITLLQVMRKVANFGAHPKKSTNSSEIADIEPGEADVMIDTIEQLFDYVFIKPKHKEEFLKKITEKYGIETEK